MKVWAMVSLLFNVYTMTMSMREAFELSYGQSYAKATGDQIVVSFQSEFLK